MKFSIDIQKVIPFGYLFLVIIGILKESVLYYQLGINILKYSSIMDILISPIATLAANPIVIIALLVLVVLCYSYPFLLSKQRHKKWAQKLSSLKNGETMSEDEISRHFTKIAIGVLASGLLSFFIGIGLGEGKNLKSKIINQKLSHNHKLNYNSGESEEIYLINSNSIYSFYVAKGSKTIKIVPIGSIKSIEFTTNKMLK